MSFLSDNAIVAKALEQYDQDAAAARVPVINQQPLEQIIARLELARHIREGGLNGPKLAEFLERYLTFATRLQHPAYMAHQVAVPIPVLSHYLANEFFGLLKWWLDARMPYPPAAMDEMFHRLVNPAINSALQDRNVR